MATSSSSSSFFSKPPNQSLNPKLTASHSHPFNLTSFNPIKCLQSHKPCFSFASSPKPTFRNHENSILSCSAVTSLPSQTTHDLASARLQRLITEFQSLSHPTDRLKWFLHYSTLLPTFDQSKKVAQNRVMGCTAQVWLDVTMDEDGTMRFLADSDSEITKGFCSCLVRVLDGATPDEVLSAKTEDFGALNVVGLNGMGNYSRGNTWYNVLISMQKRTKALVAEREGKPPGDLFPSLVVTADGIQAQGSYAEAQVTNSFL